ncbi:MAG: carbonic anhydrase family protein [Chloroflexi bacterium]|nr:carbonic anhydrase family protein [Chloroflexota bacterium]
MQSAKITGGLLEENFNSCVDGSAQSPIDVRDTVITDLQDISFHYNPAVLAISNNGHTIQASYGKTDQGDGGYMIVDGQEFLLLSFHFHRPSEHTVNGHHAAMEMHLVHKADDGTLAVVGVLIEPGTFNTQLDPIWVVMPQTAGEEVTMDTLVDVNQLLPQDLRTYRYPGSLTTPPCSQGVKWNLMTSPISVSSGQVDAFKDLYFFNARYTQPLNGRVILEDASVGK